MISLHVDVDNLWMYEQEFGIKIHADKEYIYTQSLPVFLELLKKTGSKATFMLVGQDLLLPAAQVFCKKAIALGHEIGNHTWSHPILFNTLLYKQKKEEIEKTHKQITNICGKEPVGFRGPGYYQDTDIITILRKLNYQYDSSVLPGFAHLFMSAYAYVKGGENRHKTFGRTNYILSKEYPYSVIGLQSNKTLLELPISVLPGLRLPIHTTFAYFFGSWYRELIYRFLKRNPSYVLYLFHAIDFVDLPLRKNHPVISLRYSFHQRMKFVERILTMLVDIHGGGLRTSREHITASRR